MRVYRCTLSRPRWYNRDAMGSFYDHVSLTQAQPPSPLGVLMRPTLLAPLIGQTKSNTYGKRAATGQLQWPFSVL